mgnify:FL=1
MPKIDIENMRYFNYRGELYDENKSLINDIRQRFSQKLLDDRKRNEIKELISKLDNNSMLEMSNSLEYILTYLRTINNKNIVEISTIETFTAVHMQSRAYLSKEFNQKQILSSLSLEYIIDLHELTEEYVFDAILRQSIPNELSEKSCPIGQQTSIRKQFDEMISNDKNLHDLNIWIGMFKRLLVRLLLSKVNINFDSSLHQYVKRNDMWKGNITVDNLRSIEIKENIQLKHAYIILKGLESKIDGKINFINNEVERKNIRNQNNSTASKTKKPSSRTSQRD